MAVGGAASVGPGRLPLEKNGRLIDLQWSWVRPRAGRGGLTAELVVDGKTSAEIRGVRVSRFHERDMAESGVAL